MERPPNPSLKSSGIPRFSGIPIPRRSDRLDLISDQSKYTLNRKVVPDKLPQSIQSSTSISTTGNKATAQASSSDINPANESFRGLQYKDEDSEAAPVKVRTLPRRPRPSLSDRTIETLSQIPPSPSPRRRKSSFFPVESPSKLHSRPESALSNSRPSTSHGQRPLPTRGPSSRPTSPVKRHLAPTTGNQILSTTPNRRSVSSCHPKSVPHATESYNLGDATPSKGRLPVQNRFSHVRKIQDDTRDKPIATAFRGSKTLSARPTKPRPSVQDAFTKPSVKPDDNGTIKVLDKPRVRSPCFSAESSEAVSPIPPISKRSSRTSPDSSERPSIKVPDTPKMPSSSAALRETIAKAKAARQKANKIQYKGIGGSRLQPESFPDIDFGDTSSILRKRVASARTDGKLNIAALGLKEIPPEVMNMYNANLGEGAWYESVDLVRLVAADNEIEEFDDTVFPDDARRPDDMEEDYQGNIFGGLETLDLHGNHLKTLPTGLRRLERLTTLNLSKNRLDNGSIRVISQIHSLRDLRLADNALNGTLGGELCDLQNLEVLDLHNNMISALPADISHLSNLRTLDIAGNRIETIPVECFNTLPLVVLDAARNRFCGELFPPSVKRIANLKYLDVSNNALTSVTQNLTIDFPSLQTLNVTENRLTALPEMSEWAELLTLTAGGNQLSSFPEGLTSLLRLQAIDFSRNDLKSLDERLGLMDNLTSLGVANNPLRERKFLRMGTDEIKHELSSRLYPMEPTDDWDMKSRDTAGLVPSAGAVNDWVWAVKPDGVLDRSSTKLDTIEFADLEPFVETNRVKTIVLHHNRLQMIPQSLDFLSRSLTTLDISDNKLAGAAYLPRPLSLPNLRSLNVSSNAINALSPLLDNLSAPKLAELDVSRNRLASLLPLRTAFPALVTLLAANNVICMLEVDVARGLEVLDVSGNELDRLEPKLGLLGAEGLRTLIIGGNKFRVPRRDVIDKGTEAVLTWLRGRIPDGDL